MTQECLFLTDITLHARSHRPNLQFSKIATKGIIYEPLITHNDQKTAGKELGIPLPEDLFEKINKGEIEIMVPKGGLNIYVCDDVKEKAEKKAKKERKSLIHRNRKNVWRIDKS